jgi:hypothetical protein
MAPRGSSVPPSSLGVLHLLQASRKWKLQSGQAGRIGRGRSDQSSAEMSCICCESELWCGTKGCCGSLLWCGTGHGSWTRRPGSLAAGDTKQSAVLNCC